MALLRSAMSPFGAGFSSAGLAPLARASASAAPAASAISAALGLRQSGSSQLSGAVSRGAPAAAYSSRAWSPATPLSQLAHGSFSTSLRRPSQNDFAKLHLNLSRAASTGSAPAPKSQTSSYQSVGVGSAVLLVVLGAGTSLLAFYVHKPSAFSEAASAGSTATKSTKKTPPAPRAKTVPAPPEPPKPMRDRMEALVRSLQSEIVSALQSVEVSGSTVTASDNPAEPLPSPKLFKKDEWERKEGGVGLSCVLQDGNVFEKAAVLVSVVHGPASDRLLAQMRNRWEKDSPMNTDAKYGMFAAGISLVVHPRNPNAPTVHLNYRYFELKEDGKDEPAMWWFGGGSDLTPSYLFEEDAVHFHKTIKEACDRHDPTYYPKFRDWCDKYFYIPHRNEHRGLGGIFFDDLSDRPADELIKFVEDCGRSFVKQYVPIMKARKDMPYTQAMRDWQQLRRGRYVEFNLVYDRGTKFGLATPGARIESIMCSLPLTARWEYSHSPEEGSPEAKMLDVLRTPKHWAA